METRRQLIHISGLLFVLLAQTAGRTATVFYFFTIAATFLLYSEYARREKRRFSGLLGSMEKQFREFITRFERPDSARPFLGAFWFYVGCGLAFLFFPIAIASAGCSMLAVGDAISTLVGKHLGRHMIIGEKTLEGSLSFLVSAFLISLLFVDVRLALVGSLAATAAELIPEVRRLKKIRKMGYLDDNLIIPLLACLFMSHI